MIVFNFNLSNIFYFTRNNSESHYKLCIKLLLMSMAFKSEIYSTNRFLGIRPIDKTFDAVLSLNRYRKLNRFRFH